MSSLKLSDWHESQSGIEILTYNERENISDLIMEELERRGINIQARSKLFIISDRITESELKDIVKSINREDVPIKKVN